MSDYVIEIYPDAHDESPSRTYIADDVGVLVVNAARLAEGLAEEATRLCVGEAGDDELFEIWPNEGYGTVVARENTDPQ